MTQLPCPFLPDVEFCPTTATDKTNPIGVGLLLWDGDWAVHAAEATASQLARPLIADLKAFPATNTVELNHARSPF